MAELDELTVPEIAEVLQFSLDTARARLRTARKAFEAALAAHQQQHSEEEGACQI
jgi:DNA-directed RNA polymerase specialized sigma24 family protein